MTERDSSSSQAPSRPPRAIDIGLAAAIVLICGVIAARDEVLGRGPDMVAGYTLGFIIQLFFGMIAMWAAVQIWPGLVRAGFWMSLLRIAAVHAAFDALHPLAREHPMTGAVVQGVIAIGLFLLLFRAWGVPGLGAAILVWFMKVVTALIVRETVFTMF